VCINVIIYSVHLNIVAIEKQLSVTYSEWVSVVFVINHAMRMLHIISVASLAIPLFSNYLIKDIICKQIIEN